MNEYTLDNADSFSELETRGYDLDPQDPDKRVFVVKQGGLFYCYRNSCPHTGAPLNWAGDRFLNFDQSYIQCSLHGALFRIKGGECIAGPCPGESLQRIDIKIQNNKLIVEI